MGTRNAPKGYARRQQDKQRDGAKRTVQQWNKNDKSIGGLALDMQNLARERDHYKKAWESEKEASKAAWEGMHKAIRDRKQHQLTVYLQGLATGGLFGFLIFWGLFTWLG